MAAVSYPLADHCCGDSIFLTFLPIHNIFLYSNFCYCDVWKLAFFLMRSRKYHALVAPLQTGCCQPTGALLCLLEPNCHIYSFCSWGVLCPGIIPGMGLQGPSFTVYCLCVSLYSPLLILSPFPFQAEQALLSLVQGSTAHNMRVFMDMAYHPWGGSAQFLSPRSSPSGFC